MMMMMMMMDDEKVGKSYVRKNCFSRNTKVYIYISLEGIAWAIDGSANSSGVFVFVVP